MTRSNDILEDRATQWRRAFDHSFVVAPSQDVAASTDFLAIRTGEASGYALRLDEVAALQPLPAPTPYPSQGKGLLGLGSFRGAVLPVYDLGALLGEPAAGARPAWWVVVRDAPLGLAFASFERHLRLDPGDVAGSTDSGVPAEARGHCDASLRCEGQWRPIVSIASLLVDIRATVAALQPDKENF